MGRGILTKASVMNFRIFRSPDRHGGFDLDRGVATRREYEFLVVGPVWGVPLPL